MDRSRFIRSLLLLWLPLTMLFAGVASWLADDKIEIHRTLTRETESRNIARGVEALADVIDGVARDVRFLAAHGALRAAINENTPASVAALAESLVAFSNSQRHYDRIRWIDETGMERVRVDLIDGRAMVIPRGRLQNKARRYFFIDTLAVAEGEIYVSPLDLNVDQDRIEVPHRPMLRVGTPIFDTAGRPRGIVLVNYDGRELLDGFSRAMSTSAARAMLLNRDAYWLKAPDPGDAWGFMFERSETFATRYPSVWARVQAEERGQFEDDQGIWTFATVHPLQAGEKSSTGSGQVLLPSRSRLAASEYYWKAVSQVPAANLVAHRSAVWTQYVPALVFFLLLALLASVEIAQVLEEQHLADEQLRQSHAELEQKVVERTALLAEREHEHLQVLEASPFAIAVSRLSDGTLIYGNPAFLTLMGFDKDQLASIPAQDLYVNPAQRKAMVETLREHGRADGEVRVRVAHGREIDSIIAARTTRFAGEPALIASFVDITARKTAEAALHASQQRYRQLFEAESDAILLVDNQTGRILEANSAAARLYGYTQDELRTMTNDELSAEPEATRQITRDSRSDIDAVVQVPLGRHRRRDGGVFPVEINGRFFELEGRGVHIAAIREVTARIETETALRDANAQLLQQLAEIEALQVSLKEQAIRDGLTGLFNRRFLEETCTRELARAQREGYPVALAMFDLDLFKCTNDTYGHAAGDEVIIGLARLLQANARSSDTPCRFGGEEFVLLLPGIDLETAAARVDELRQSFADAMIPFGAFRLRATVSAGVAAYPAHGLSTRELVARADEALYRAKRAGRNRVEIWNNEPNAA